MKAKKLLSLVGFLAFIALMSCSKDDTKPKPTASFTATTRASGWERLTCSHPAG